MKAIKINHHHSVYDSFEPMWQEDACQLIQQEADKIAPEPPIGFDIWDARKRRKIVRDTVDGVSVTHSLHRAPNAWCVYQTRTIKSEHFVVVVEQWWEWDYDAAMPFPYACYQPQGYSIWDDITGDSVGLTLKGSLAHFLTFAKLDRDTANAIIDQCEDDGEISVTDAMLARLTI
ncbi:hypothetical protein EWE75_01330 [Sphingomonas populi]|uniref:Uncharacterized protein n=1 Tax=Sphingomonas populi TaxID=2484750 RepID=A0A4Q6XZZ2_9SPHN|nr:hypothetical protein [Sphingomonas populi]RZF66523.1 hypothetical protein EWE75_01330 [Sphingomonas populi]